MDRAVAYNKAIQSYNNDSIFVQIYNDTLYNFDNPSDALKTYMNDLDILDAGMYDTTWTIAEAGKISFKRRDFLSACDVLCDILAQNITDLCKHQYIVMPPQRHTPNNEQTCPFPRESLVAYGNVTDIIKYEGKTYKIIDTKLEETAYYTIKVSLFDN
jgi:hypothetical protein